MSLRNQLLAAISALFLVVLLVMLAVSVSGTRSYLEQQLGSHAQDAATALSVSLSPSVAKGDLVLAQAQLSSVFDRGYFKRIAVLGPDRSPLMQRAMPEKVEGVPGWFVALLPIDTPPGEAFLGSGWKQLGKVLVISQPTYAYQYLWGSALQMVVWLAGVFLLTLGAALVVLQFILRPLRAIEETAIGIQAKRFGQIEHTPRAPELASVVRAMNQMSRKVGEMLDSETARAQLLHKQAYEDELTGLANRRGFELRMDELLQDEQRQGQAAVVAMGVDDLQLLSRSQGYGASTRVLKAIAEHAQRLYADQPSALLARSNDNYFTFVSTEQTPAAVKTLAAALRSRVLQQLIDDPALTVVSINTGVAFIQAHDKRSDVLSRADLAVESARQQERNGLYVLEDQANENAALGSFGWRTLIQTALLENRWRLLRQPVVSLADPNVVLQQECLARLVDTQGQLVPASQFMPMAARHRLMSDIDRAIVTLAMQYLRDHPGNRATVAINISPQSMADKSFMRWLQGKLEALEDRASQFAIEVSEFGALRRLEDTVLARDMIRKLGGQFGIDHFGLDPQALTLLRELVPDYVKLSGSLMEEIERGEAVTHMLQSFVTLAHSLEVRVVAQQVERAEQVAVLLQAQVDAGQGYLFSAPV